MQAAARRGSGAGTRNQKTNNDSNRGAGGSKADKNASVGPNGKTPKPGVEHKTARETPFTRTSNGKASPTGKPGKDSAGTSKTTKADTTGTKPGKTPPAPGATDGKGGGKGGSKVDLNKKPNQKDKKSAPGPDNGKTSKTDKNVDLKKTGPKTAPSPSSGSGAKVQINTQESRETGYRDGTRVAKVTAHVKAYRDGFADGHTDTTEAADREKARLDQAHQDHKQKPEEQQVPAAASSADHHQPQ
ncbi:hypothetical protein ACFQ51_57000, partial [Streptomyces kaempferi]